MCGKAVIYQGCSFHIYYSSLYIYNISTILMLNDCRLKFKGRKSDVHACQIPNLLQIKFVHILFMHISKSHSWTFFAKTYQESYLEHFCTGSHNRELKPHCQQILHLWTNLMLHTRSIWSHSLQQVNISHSELKLVFHACNAMAFTCSHACKQNTLICSHNCKPTLFTFSLSVNQHFSHYHGL